MDMSLVNMVDYNIIVKEVCASQDFSATCCGGSEFLKLKRIRLLGLVTT